MRNYEREQAPLIIGLFSAFRCCLKYRDKNGLCFKQGFDGWLLKSNQLICIFCPRQSRRRQSLTCKSIAHSTALKENVSFLQFTKSCDTIECFCKTICMTYFFQLRQKISSSFLHELSRSKVIILSTSPVNDCNGK